MGAASGALRLGVRLESRSRSRIMKAKFSISTRAMWISPLTLLGNTGVARCFTRSLYFPDGCGRALVVKHPQLCFPDFSFVVGRLGDSVAWAAC